MELISLLLRVMKKVKHRVIQRDLTTAAAPLMEGETEEERERNSVCVRGAREGKSNTEVGVTSAAINSLIYKNIPYRQRHLWP